MILILFSSVLCYIIFSFMLIQLLFHLILYNIILFYIISSYFNLLYLLYLIWSDLNFFYFVTCLFYLILIYFSFHPEGALECLVGHPMDTIRVRIITNTGSKIGIIGHLKSAFSTPGGIASLYRGTQRCVHRILFIWIRNLYYTKYTITFCFLIDQFLSSLLHHVRHVCFLFSITHSSSFLSDEFNHGYPIQSIYVKTSHFSPLPLGWHDYETVTKMYIFTADYVIRRILE